MPVVGHVPFAAGIQGALAARQKSIEHLRGYIEKLVPADAPIQPGIDLRSRTLAWEYADLSRIPELVRATRDAGAWQCPTLGRATAPSNRDATSRRPKPSISTRRRARLSAPRTREVAEQFHRSRLRASDARQRQTGSATTRHARGGRAAAGGHGLQLVRLLPASRARSARRSRAQPGRGAADGDDQSGALRRARERSGTRREQATRPISSCSTPTHFRTFATRAGSTRSSCAASCWIGRARRDAGESEGATSVTTRKWKARWRAMRFRQRGAGRCSSASAAGTSTRGSC